MIQSLLYGLENQPINAAISLLNIFHSDPSLARSEIAPALFKDLFLVHLIRVHEWFNEQRSTICSSSTSTSDYSCEFSLVLPCTKLLSNMSEGQASELESTYEKVVDENCRLLVKYFKEVLENKDENKLINLPPFTLRNSEKVDTFEYSEDEKIEKEDLVLQNGRYNVMLYFLTIFLNCFIFIMLSQTST